MLEMNRLMHVFAAQFGFRPAQHAFRRGVHEGYTPVSIQRIGSFAKIIGNGAQKIEQARAPLIRIARLWGRFCHNRVIRRNRPCDSRL
jgi:hypothetical protein